GYRRCRAAGADDIVPAEPAGQPGRRPRSLRRPARDRWPADPGHSRLPVRLVRAPGEMTTIGQRRAAAAAWALVAAIAAAGLAETIAARKYLATSDAITSLCTVPAAILYATVGAVI